MKGKRDD